MTQADLSPTFSTVEQARTSLIERLAVSKPYRILYIADAQDLMERAEHLQQVLGAVLDYVGAIVADTSHIAPGGSIDRKYLLGLISDLAGDVAGSISNAADDLVAGRVDEPSRASASTQSLLAWLLVDPFPEPDAGSATVLVDELGARLLKSRPYLVSGVGSAAQGTVMSLKSLDGGDRHIRGECQLLLRPTQERASSLNLAD
jgi:hypothetical protein